MRSILRVDVQQRADHIRDVYHGAQASADGMKSYIGSLEKGVGEVPAGAGSLQELGSDVSKGEHAMGGRKSMRG